MGARPSLLFGAVILLIPVMQGWREKRRVWPLLLAAGGPIVAVGLGLMVYNALRFDNPLEFGQRYQLPMTPHQQFSPRFLWFNFRVGFLEPARWPSSLPLVRDARGVADIDLPALPRGYSSVDYPFGILTNIPLVWLALAAPLAWRSRSGEARCVLRGFLGAVAVLFGAGAFLLCLHDSMAVRYELEYAWPLLMLAVVGVLALERALAGHPVWRRAARCGWVLLLAVSLGFNLFASVEMQVANHTNIGNVLLQSGRVEEAVTHYRKALQLNPENMEAHNNLGNALLQQGGVDGAILQFQTALQINSNSSDAHYNLGNALLRKGSVDEAILQFQTALQIKPGAADTHVNLGNALLQKARVDDAIAEFQKALQINADSSDAHYNLGNALLQKGRADEAISEYQKVLQIKPDYVEAHNNLSAALLQRGRVDEAISEYQKALQIKPDYADAEYNLAHALLQKGRVEEAIAGFQKALQIQPANPTFQVSLAWLLATAPEASLRDGAKAVELARQADKLADGQNPVILRTLAAACAEAGRFPDAVETAQRALRLTEAQSDTESAGELRSELRLYQAGSAFHSPKQP